MRLLTVVCAASVVLPGAAASAGPLNPPAGAVAATGKTLAEVEPRRAITAANTPGDANSLFKITQSGSYYLTGNVAGEPNKHGIEVAADNVTIDLNGFTVQGAQNALDAIRSDGGSQLTGLTVRNGTIKEWSNGSGVYAGGISQCRAENLTISTMGFEGVWFGAGSTVERCDVRSVRGGVRVGASSFVRDCVVQSTSEKGVYTGPDSVVTGCWVRSTTGVGIDVQSRGTVEGCRVQLAGNVGVQGVEGCVFRSVTVLNSTGPGILGQARCVFEGCVVDTAGDAGIMGFQDCRVERCEVSDASSHGVNVQGGSVVLDCTTRSCTFNGINASGSCTVRGCASTDNGLHGIAVDQRSTVIGNRCNSNGTNSTTGAGIRVNGGGCRVEDNHCCGSDLGVWVAGVGTLIVRNTCASNTANWNIGSNNVYGPIIDRTAPASAAVVGNSAADTTNSTHPNANFSQ